MGVIETQIAKARARFEPDVAKALRTPNAKPLEIIADRDPVVEDRLDFLAASLPDPSDAVQALERILFGNDLLPANYFERGAIAARAVARIAIRSPQGAGWGTGFLVCPGVMLTNNHVFPTSGVAKGSLAQFEYDVLAVNSSK